MIFDALSGYTVTEKDLSMKLDVAPLYVQQ